MLENSKCSLCGDRDMVVDHMIFEYSKPTQKLYWVRYDGVGKVIYW